MKAADQIKSRSTDSVQLYGAFVGDEDPGCQDYARAIKLQGVRIVDAKWLESLATAHDDLLESLEAILPFADEFQDCGPVGAGWKSDFVRKKLEAARAAIAKAKGITQ